MHPRLALMSNTKAGASEIARAKRTRWGAKRNANEGQTFATAAGTCPYVQVWPLARISHTPENDDIYKPIALDSPDISDLARSILRKTAFRSRSLFPPTDTS